MEALHGLRHWAAAFCCAGGDIRRLPPSSGWLARTSCLGVDLPSLHRSAVHGHGASTVLAVLRRVHLSRMATCPPRLSARRLSNSSAWWDEAALGMLMKPRVARASTGRRWLGIGCSCCCRSSSVSFCGVGSAKGCTGHPGLSRRVDRGSVLLGVYYRVLDEHGRGTCGARVSHVAVWSRSGGVRRAAGSIMLGITVPVRLARLNRADTTVMLLRLQEEKCVRAADGAGVFFGNRRRGPDHVCD